MSTSDGSVPASQPKGILKAPTAAFPAHNAATTNRASVATGAVSSSSNKPSAREIATQHAQIIHQRRELEDRVSDYIIALAKYPLVRDQASYGAANPAPSDAADFKGMVRLFQPGDLEDLIEERNANGLCGYAMCPRPRTQVKGGGAWKLLNYGKADFSIVPRKELERWCSQQCTRRAMYIKVQLNETAAWERAGIPSIQIDLLDEPHELKRDEENDPASRVAKELQNLKIEADQKAVQQATDLAAERGDTAENKFKSDRRVPVTIKEKSIIAAAQEPVKSPDEGGHLIMDGYKTKFDPSSETVHDVKGAKEHPGTEAQEQAK